MSKARELAELIGNAGGTSEQVLSGRRNLIINGGFDVWQRGTSFSNYVGYTADRWFIANPATMSVSKVTTPYGNGVSYTRSANWGARYRIEWADVNWLKDGDVLTLQYKSNRTSTKTIRLSDFNASVTSNFVMAFSDEGNGYYHCEGKAIVTQSLIDACSVDGYLQLELEVYDQAGEVTFTQVQLELGSVATPFEHRSYGEELALCQRYYCHSNSPNSPPNLNTYHYYANSAMAVDFEDLAPTSLQFPVPMRTSPSMSYARLYSYNGSTWKNIQGLYVGQNGGGSLSHDGGYQVGRPALFAWIADAEL